MVVFIWLTITCSKVRCQVISRVSLMISNTPCGMEKCCSNKVPFILFSSNCPSLPSGATTALKPNLKTLSNVLSSGSCQDDDGEEDHHSSRDAHGRERFVKYQGSQGDGDNRLDGR